MESARKTRLAPKPLRREWSCGMTLVEAMMVLAIVAVLLASAVPGIAGIVSNHRATTAIGDLAHDIALARAEAQKRARRVYLAPFGARWHDGWAVFVDRNDNRRFDGPAGTPEDELIAQHGPLPESIAVANSSGAATEPFLDTGSPPLPYVMFDGAGYPRRRNGALGIGGIVVTDHTGGARSIRTLCLASYGRVRIVRDRAGCS